MNFGLAVESEKHCLSQSNRDHRVGFLDPCIDVAERLRPCLRPLAKQLVPLMLINTGALACSCVWGYAPSAKPPALQVVDNIFSVPL